MNDEFSYSGKTGEVVTQSTISDKSKFCAALLSLFLGMLGIHRFYLGRYGTGIVLLGLTLFGWLTLGFFIGIPFLFLAAVWDCIDFFRIICNGMSDSQGRKLRQ